MKKNYILGLLVVIIILLVVILVRKPAAAPTGTEPTPTPTSAASTAPTKQPGAQGTVAPTASMVTVNVNKATGPTVYAYPATVSSTTIIVESPAANTTAVSPITISGKAIGSWFFEGTASVILVDSKGKVIARTNVAALSDWKTTAMVPFLGKLTYPAQPTGSTGVVILKNANPSGLKANDKWVEILVTFK